MGRNPYFSLFQTVPAKEDIERVVTIMERFNILNLRHRTYSELSGGELRLLLVLRALVQGAELLLLDEPMANLDLKNQYIIWNTLKKLKARGISTLITTHDPNHILWNCDMVTVIHNGEIVSQGIPDRVITESLLTKLFGKICRIETLSNNKKAVIMD